MPLTIFSRRHRWLVLAPLTLLGAGAALLGIRSMNADSRSASGEADSPAACVSRLLAAEERGDVAAYLDCFCPAERSEFESLWQGQSRSQIESELRSRSVETVGQATSKLEFVDQDHARLLLERIRRDASDHQQVTLQRNGGRWQISSLATPESQSPAIPYGTPVFAQE